MFNPQHMTSASSRALIFQQALAAACKARKQNLPAVPASMPVLFAEADKGPSQLLSRPDARQALNEIRARLFQAPGRDIEAQSAWHESVATAVFAARVAQLRGACVCVSFCGGLLHRAGEALALNTLARVELDHRLQLDSASRRDWCANNGPELAERLVRAWEVPAEVAACVVGWKRFGEFAQVSAESAALYFGRLFAVEVLHPQFCVPGAIDHAAAELGLAPDCVAQVRAEEPRVQDLIHALD